MRRAFRIGCCRKGNTVSRGHYRRNHHGREVRVLGGGDPCEAVHKGFGSLNFIQSLRMQNNALQNLATRCKTAIVAQHHLKDDDRRLCRLCIIFWFRLTGSESAATLALHDPPQAMIFF